MSTRRRDWDWGVLVGLGVGASAGAASALVIALNTVVPDVIDRASILTGIAGVALLTLLSGIVAVPVGIVCGVALAVPLYPISLLPAPVAYLGSIVVTAVVPAYLSYPWDNGSDMGVKLTIAGICLVAAVVYPWLIRRRFRPESVRPEGVWPESVRPE
jgi:hypothetical protein